MLNSISSILVIFHLPSSSCSHFIFACSSSLIFIGVLKSPLITVRLSLISASIMLGSSFSNLDLIELIFLSMLPIKLSFSSFRISGRLSANSAKKAINSAAPQVKGQVKGVYPSSLYSLVPSALSTARILSEVGGILPTSRALAFQSLNMATRDICSGISPFLVYFINQAATLVILSIYSSCLSNTFFFSLATLIKSR